MVPLKMHRVVRVRPTGARADTRAEPSEGLCSGDRHGRRLLVGYFQQQQQQQQQALSYGTGSWTPGSGMTEEGASASTLPPPAHPRMLGLGGDSVVWDQIIYVLLVTFPNAMTEYLTKATQEGRVYYSCSSGTRNQHQEHQAVIPYAAWKRVCACECVCECVCVCVCVCVSGCCLLGIFLFIPPRSPAP